MNGLAVSILSDPQGWAKAVSILVVAPTSLFLGWLWRQYTKLRDRVSDCETDRALLRREVDELKGSVSVLTALLKKEANIG